MVGSERSGKRTSPRMRVLKTAHIVLSDKAPKLACTVRNLSGTGAALELESTTVGLPQTFVLVVNGARHSCQATWRTETRMGVKFLAEADNSAAPVRATPSAA